MFACFTDHHRQAFFKVTAITGSCDEAGERKLDKTAPTEIFGDSVSVDALRQTFDEGGFSNACFSYDQGLVFGTPK